MITVLKRILKKVIPKALIPKTYFYYNSYSQAGEDAIISYLFQDKKINKISYLDLGTNNPDFGNNTFLFYNRGSRGVCVEADKNLIPNIKLKRPEDITLNFGVSDGKVEYADFYIFDNPALNTFDKSEAQERENQGSFKIITTEKVLLKTIDDIIKNNFSHYPDFLSIDIEGLDLLVLKTLDFITSPIPVICVETCIYSENHVRPKNSEIINFMLSQNYFIYADTYINTIFVNKDWFYKN